MFRLVRVQYRHFSEHISCVCLCVYSGARVSLYDYSQHGDAAIRYIAAAPVSDQWVWSRVWSVIELKAGLAVGSVDVVIRVSLIW